VVNHARDFEEFYAANYGKVAALVTAVILDRHEADDITQETFARALARWPRLSGYELPEAWVRRVAMRLAIDSRRRVRRMMRGLPRLRAAITSAAPPPEPGDMLAFSALGRALARIPLREREVIVLHYVADMAVDQIARERGIGVSTVKSRLAAGRRRLERELAEREPAHEREEARDA
jgi:RNA polymerase sigma-70 factor (ECF subfamily)